MRRGVARECVPDGAKDERGDQAKEEVACARQGAHRTRRRLYFSAGPPAACKGAKDAQFPSCQIAIVVRASAVAGTADPSGTSWWWNQAAPGCHQAIIAGRTVDTGAALSAHCPPRVGRMLGCPYLVRSAGRAAGRNPVERESRILAACSTRGGSATEACLEWLSNLYKLVLRCLQSYAYEGQRRG